MKYEGKVNGFDVYSDENIKDRCAYFFSGELGKYLHEQALIDRVIEASRDEEE